MRKYLKMSEGTRGKSGMWRLKAMVLLRISGAEEVCGGRRTEARNLQGLIPRDSTVAS